MKPRKPLSPETRRAVWAPSAANAGAGWKSETRRGFEDSPAAEDFSEAEEPMAVDRFIARGKR